MDPDYDTGWAPGQGSCWVPLAGAALTACSGRSQGARIVSHAAELSATFVFDAHPANSKRGATAGLALPAAVATPFVNGQTSTGTLYVIFVPLRPAGDVYRDRAACRSWIQGGRGHSTSVHLARGTSIAAIAVQARARGRKDADAPRPDLLQPPPLGFCGAATAAPDDAGRANPACLARRGTRNHRRGLLLDVRTIQRSLSVVVPRLTSRLNRVDRMRAQTRLLVDAGDARGLTDVAPGTPGLQALLL